MGIKLFRKRSVKKSKGFTLLEVMVVIVILGTIAGMVVPSLMGSQNEANIAAARIEIRTIETSMKMYKLKNNVYPSTEQGLEALVVQTDIEPIPRSFPEEGYLPEMPKDPWNNEYLLISPGDNGIYDIFSMGPDGQAETEDDIGNWKAEDENY
ncbi:MAG: type II secretion system major pseudopilin GspG [Psychrosphaera sp.]|nr:type II secretion system major pseudopilin GspG [Psychrosphaera sp.]